MKNLKAIREELGAGEWGTPELINKYKQGTPGQDVNPDKIQTNELCGYPTTYDEAAGMSPDAQNLRSLGHLSYHAAQATAKALKFPSRDNHLKAMQAHQMAHAVSQGGAVAYHDSKAKEHATAAKSMKEGLEDACWKGYEAIGTKQKNGKTVPNCVPKEETMEEDHLSDYSAKAHAASQKANASNTKADHEAASKAHTAAYTAHTIDKKSSEAGHHLDQAAKHAAMAAKSMKEEADPFDKKNERIALRKKMALDAQKRGDHSMHKWHLSKATKLERGIDEAMDYKEDESEEVGMACRQLRKIAVMAMSIENKLMNDDEALQAWMQSKIAIASDKIDEVFSNVMFSNPQDADKKYEEEEEKNEKA